MHPIFTLLFDNVICNQALRVVLNSSHGLPESSLSNASVQSNTEFDSVHANARIGRLKTPARQVGKLQELFMGGDVLGPFGKHLLEDVKAHAKSAAAFSCGVVAGLQALREHNDSLGAVAEGDKLICQKLQAANHMSSGIVAAASLEEGLKTPRNMGLEIPSLLFQQQLDCCEDLSFYILRFACWEI